MNKLLEVCRSYVGIKERGKNEGFSDPNFEKKMRGVGWKPLQQWCCYAGKLCLKEAGDERWKLVQPSTKATQRAFEKAGYEYSRIPVPGSVVIWRKFINGVAQDAGHFGLLASGDSTSFNTYEGNVSDAFNERKHSYNWTEKNGNRLIGFFNPK